MDELRRITGGGKLPSVMLLSSFLFAFSSGDKEEF